MSAAAAGLTPGGPISFQYLSDWLSSVELAAIESRLAEIHCGRKWILVTQVAVGAADMVPTLAEWGPPGS